MRRTLVLILIALILGGAASWIAYNRVKVQTASTETNIAQVVVAAFDIEYGQTVAAEQVKLAAWPKDSVPEGAYTSVEAAVGKLASMAIVKGEPLTDRRVVENLGGSALANLIEPNKRAMTVRVNDVVGVGGFLLPGNRVDVIATRRGRGDDRAETKTVLQNLKVLAVDQQARTEEDKPVVVRAVTVEVDPKEAEILTTATAEGTVQLVLRNPLDSTEVAEEKPVEKPKPVVRRAAVKQPSSPQVDPNTAAVQIIRGTAADTSKAQK